MVPFFKPSLLQVDLQEQQLMINPEQKLPYPLFLQQRVRSSQGHLSNEDGADFFKKIISDQLQVAVLAHLSETNNTSQLARAAAEKILPADWEAELMAASQDKPTPFFTLTAV